jgi:hypothetical protein
VDEQARSYCTGDITWNNRLPKGAERMADEIAEVGYGFHNKL